MNAFGLALHAFEEIFLVGFIETTGEKQFFEAENRGDGIADLVRQSCGKSSDGSETFRPDETRLRLFQLLCVTRGFVDFGAKFFFIGAQTFGHLRQTPAQIREFSRTCTRHFQTAITFGDTGGCPGQTFDRINHETRHRDVHEDEQSEREDAHVQREEAHERRAGDDARHGCSREARDGEEERQERQDEKRSQGDEQLKPDAGAHAIRLSGMSKNWAGCTGF